VVASELVGELRSLRVDPHKVEEKPCAQRAHRDEAGQEDSQRAQLAEATGENRVHQSGPTRGL
jgi:hypothetical protein